MMAKLTDTNLPADFQKIFQVEVLLVLSTDMLVALFFQWFVTQDDKKYA